MYKMKQILFSLLAAALFSACTQDELAEQSAALPDGAYPIIFSVIQVTEASPQTRVSDYDDTDGTHKSRWTEGDKIKVTVMQGSTTETTTCTLDADGNITAYDPQLYWQNTSSATINAWYSNITGQNTTDENRTISLADQSGGLAYVLKATPITANYQTTNIQLSFAHQLAKIRVKLDGEKAADVTSVSVKSNTGCTVSNGDVTGSGEGFIPMHKATYGNNTYWEANVVSGKAISDFQLSDGTKTVTCTLTAAVTPVAATLHGITITVNPATVADGATITESGEYTMSGTYTQGVTIDATDKDITLILDGVTVNNTSGPGISITGGSPTIQVSGDKNTVTSTTATAINVSSGATVTIEGKTGATDKLTATGGKTQGSGVPPGIGNPGAGIGTSDGGNIVIRNVMVDATGATASDYMGVDAFGAAAIGSANGNCGNITIQNAIINARGGFFSPAIGLGCGLNSGTYTIGNILIESSTINATGGSSASVIGFPYGMPGNGNFNNITINAGKIVLKTDNADYLSQLTLTSTTASGPNFRTAYKIGKGVYHTTYTTFHNATGNGDWEGVEVYVNNTLSTSSADGVGQ